MILTPNKLQRGQAMTEREIRPFSRPKFTLMSLLTLTAMVALGTACSLAYRKNRSMIEERDQLRPLSRQARLDMIDEDDWFSVELPRVAHQFRSWNVFVPSGASGGAAIGNWGDTTNRGAPNRWSHAHAPGNTSSDRSGEGVQQGGVSLYRLH